ncbi:MAG: hypothetical protein PHV68_04645 [Candidatus Gastranaerophilales bacterium]|nr:hypothetical protein [Candidatus Gastranaerophilales bacterium]
MGVVFFYSKSLDYRVFLYALKVGLSGAFVAGMLGFLMGRILETSVVEKDSKKDSKNKKLKLKNQDRDLLINDLLIDELDKISKEDISKSLEGDEDDDN